eukprot:jgi/Hompol1/1716/HPOL_000255-RA
MSQQPRLQLPPQAHLQSHPHPQSQPQSHTQSHSQSNSLLQPLARINTWSTAATPASVSAFESFKQRKDAQRRRMADKYLVDGFISAGTYGRVYKARKIPAASSAPLTDAIGPGGILATSASAIASSSSLSAVAAPSDRIPEFAIKKFKPDKEGESALSSGISQSACREIALCRELHHENVVNLEEVMLDPKDRSISMVLEYCEHDLLQILHFHSHHERKPLPEYTIKSFLWQLLNGLAYLHANWILHRDLKPANILVTSDGVLKIADLGLARIFQAPLQPLFHGDKVVVTIWYRAPELLLGSRHYTKAIDIWAVGCIFAELLMLRPIFKGDEAKMDNKKTIPFQRDQVVKIFDILGTPTVDRWPGIEHMPEYANLRDIQRPTTNNLRSVYNQSSSVKSESGFHLLLNTLEYNPEKRFSADAALSHTYFDEDPKPGAKTVPVRSLHWTRLLRQECGDDIDDIQTEIRMLSDLRCEWLNRYGVFSEEQVAFTMHQLLKGLAYIHGLGKIHRDIKAANILMMANGTVKLADFGVSGQITSTITKKNTFIGTPYWMAPEVILRSNYNSKANIWSLGITAWELATGFPPHANVHPMRVLFMIPKQQPPKLDSRFSEAFRDFVAQCLTMRPKERPNASRLILHPFVSNAPDQSPLIECLIMNPTTNVVQPDTSQLTGSGELEHKGAALPTDPSETTWNFDPETELSQTAPQAIQLPSVRSEAISNAEHLQLETIARLQSGAPTQISTNKSGQLGRGVAFEDEFDLEPAFIDPSSRTNVDNGSINGANPSDMSWCPREYRSQIANSLLSRWQLR